MGQRTEQEYIKESRETKYRSVGRNFTEEDCTEDGSQSNGTDIRIRIGKELLLFADIKT